MPDAVTIGLYYLFLLTGIILTFILLINNFVFYRRKLKDDISLMIIFCFATCLFELLWTVTQGKAGLSALTYTFAISYLIFALVFASFFNRFFLKFFNYFPKKKWLQALIYWLPNVAAFVLCVTTPWTHLVFSMDDKGYIAEETLFLFVEILVALYFIASLVVSIVYFIKNKESKKATKKVIFMLIGFVVIAPLTLAIQYAMLGNLTFDYVNLSICYAIALTFLVSNLNAYLLVESEGKMKAIETELKIASKIQEDALPIGNPDFSDKFEIALRASMSTAKDVGGDFYDYFPLDDHRLCFLIADVSGKGTPAALFMMTAKTVIKDHAMIYNSTSEILTLANSRLCEGNKEMMFATAWIGILDFKEMTLEYTNAGHNYPLLYQKNGLLFLKKVDGTMLGIMKGMKYKSNTIKVEPGDRIFLYTDGVTEAHDLEGKLYGDDRLIKVFTENINNSEEDTVDAIHNDIVKFANGADQFDDITMMVTTIK